MCHLGNEIGARWVQREFVADFVQHGLAAVDGRLGGIPMAHPGGRDGDPSDGVGPVSGRRIGTTAEISNTQATDGADGAQAADAAGGADAVAEVQSAAGAGEVDAVADIAAGLETGAIDPAQARAALIEQALAAHLPPGADEALVAEVRANLEAALANDPTIASLLS